MTAEDLQYPPVKRVELSADRGRDRVVHARTLCTVISRCQASITHPFHHRPATAPVRRLRRSDSTRLGSGNSRPSCAMTLAVAWLARRLVRCRSTTYDLPFGLEYRTTISRNRAHARLLDQLYLEPVQLRRTRGDPFLYLGVHHAPERTSGADPDGREPACDGCSSTNFRHTQRGSTLSRRVVAPAEVRGQPHQTQPRPAHRAGEDAAETDAVPTSPHRRAHRQDPKSRSESILGPPAPSLRLCLLSFTPPSGT